MPSTGEDAEGSPCSFSRLEKDYKGHDSRKNLYSGDKRAEEKSSEEWFKQAERS